MTESFLDSFSERIGLLGAAAFITTWVIGAAHGLSGAEGFPWQRTSFKISAGSFIVLITLSIISGNILQSRALQEIAKFTKSIKLKKIVLYNNHCQVVQTDYLGKSLNKLNNNSPSGSRFLGKKYRLAIINEDTIARFKLVQNNYDTTLYQLFYLKYATTSGNSIGLIRIEPSITKYCK